MTIYQLIGILIATGLTLTALPFYLQIIASSVSYGWHHSRFSATRNFAEEIKEPKEHD